jgi:aspartate racemase
MKKIGIVGGISWSSTIEYYRLLNEVANRELGGLHYPECVIYSVNFDEFCKANAAHDWDATFRLLLNAVQKLKQAGVDIILLAANTAHIVADRIRHNIDIELIDIREATAGAIKNENITEIGLLGTIYTMELDFYKSKLIEQGMVPLIPQSKSERIYIEDTLVNELGKGIVLSETRVQYQKIIQKLIERGANGIILGCTEIPLIIKPQHVQVPVFNTIEIHVKAAIEAALA